MACRVWDGEYLKKGRIVFLMVGILFVALLAAVFLYYRDGRPALQKQQYPLLYTQELQAAAAEFELPPALIAAVIYTESRFQADAVSPRGALGLMQLMPDTAREIDEKLLGESQDADALQDANFTAYVTDAARNIRYGCYYLRWLLNRYDGRLALALAAYNAGPGRVSGWITEYGLTEDGQALLTIPYPETEDYVTRVMDALAHYETLYAEELNPHD